MDRLTIFQQGTTEVSIESKTNNTIDTVVDELVDVVRELRLTRAGHEAWTWGEDVEDSEDIDIEEITESLEGD